FFEANGFGARYAITYVAAASRVRTAQGLVLEASTTLPDPRPGDTLLVPGLESTTIDRLEPPPAAWFRAAIRAGARIASVCSGAFVLGAAGILDGRACTTHWKVTDRLEAMHPRARVLRNRLYVEDGPIVSSAGVASGIDMALALVEKDYGALVAARAAREMVVYVRRSGEREQMSVFLEYRTHLNEGVHRVQDWLIAHPDARPTLDGLARVAAMSRRHLTRVFRQATGITLKAFTTRIRLRVAGDLLRDPDRTVESVAASCGFRDARQLRRIWLENYGTTPGAWRSGDTGGISVH
ncbi:MAG TPA: helix-turn-helix domain-containing protein, partial [Candidatus Polarisedimenticolia bacterium]|nr:helix-turn-helix domain-containing protein [Candidatus Polarisedimenticolia bacterium]